MATPSANAGATNAACFRSYHRQRRAAPTEPYCLLDRTVRVLCVDDEPDVLDFLVAALCHVPLFDVVTATTGSEAVSALRADRRVNVCVYDLLLPDTAADPTSVIRTFHHRTSFVVVSGSDDLALAVQASRAGARAVHQKDRLPLNLLYSTVLDAFFCSIINPLHRPDTQSVIDAASGALLAVPFWTTTAWARSTGHGDPSHNALWHRYFSTQRRELILLRRLYAAAFSWYTQPVLQRELPPSYHRDMLRFSARRSRLLQVLGQPPQLPECPD